MLAFKLDLACNTGKCTLLDSRAKLEFPLKMQKVDMNQVNLAVLSYKDYADLKKSEHSEEEDVVVDSRDLVKGSGWGGGVISNLLLNRKMSNLSKLIPVLAEQCGFQYLICRPFLFVRPNITWTPS